MAVRNIAEITSDIDFGEHADEAASHILAEVSVNGNPWLSTKGTTVARNNLVAPATAVDATGTRIEGKIPQNDTDAIHLDEISHDLVVPAGMYASNKTFNIVDSLSQLIIGEETVSENRTYDVLYDKTITVAVKQGALSPGTLTVTPSIQTQTFAASTELPYDGHDAFNKVIVNAVEINGLSPENIKTGATIQIGDSSDEDSIASVTGTFTSDANALAADLSDGKTAYVNGVKITGTMPNNGTVSHTLDISNQSYTIPEGRHSGSGIINIEPESITVDPDTIEQTIAPTEGKVISQVTVNPIPLQSKTVSPRESAQTITADNGYKGLSTVTVEGMPGGGLHPQTVEGVIPTENSQTIRPDDGYDSISSVQINGIPNTYVGTGVIRRTDITTNNIQTIDSAYFTGTNFRVSAEVASGASRISLQGLSLSGALYPGDKLSINGTSYTVLNKTEVDTSTTINNISISPAVTTSIPSGTTVIVTLTSPQIGVQSGYYENSIIKRIAVTDHASPVLTQTVNSSNNLVITARHTQTPGYIKLPASTHTTGANLYITGIPETTYYPSAEDQTIAAERYTVGAQTIKGVTTTNLAVENIKSGVVVEVGDEVDTDRIVRVIGTYTADATATATDILSEKTAYINGQKVTGAMADNGAVTHTLDASTGNQSYTIPAGKHNGEGSVEIALEQKTATPSTSTQTVTPTSGKVLSQVTINPIPSQYIIPVLQAKTVNPSESRQTVTPDSGNDGLSSVTVNAIPSTYVGSDIDLRNATDVTVSGASVTTPAGYYEDNVTKSVATGTAGTPTITKNVSTSDHVATLTSSVTNTTGYITGGIAIAGETVTISAAELVSGTKTISRNDTGISVANYAYVDVNVPTGTASISTQSKEVTPSSFIQIIEPDAEHDALSSVQVNAIPSNYADVTNDTATAASMLSGKTAHILANGVATQITGTIPTKSWEDITYQSSGNNLEFEIPYGFYFAEEARINGVDHPAPVISLDEINRGRIVATHTQPIGWNGRDTETTAQVNITTKASATYYPSSTDQTIASGRYLIGTQTIKAVTSTNLAAENIKSGVTVEIGDESDSDRVTSVTGTYTSDATATAAAILADETAYVDGVKITGTIPTISLPTTTAIAATTGYINKATIGRGTSAQFINIPAGYNATGAYYQISGVPNGSVSAPSAAKGTVENNSISITPSVVSTTGYITGGTVSGTPVSITAAELVSGTKSISVNGTQIDVTNFQYVDVTVPSEATPMTAATILSICTIE